jgi:4-amino-4-deoxy-L-arabinose transferase-like glycosyltransferase
VFIRRQWFAPGLVLLLALLLRIGWGMVQPAQVDSRLPDQHEYLQLAQNLLAGDGLKFHDGRFGQDLYAYRSPGYPLFLAATGASPRPARLAQALLDTSTILAVYLLAGRWLTRGASLLAAIAVALNPFLIYFSGLILSETMFVAMLVWGMALLAWRRSWPLGGLLLALSVLVRPSALFLPALLAFLAAFMHRERPGWRPGATASAPAGDAAGTSVGATGPALEGAGHSWRPLAAGAAMLLLTAIVLLPWGWRNQRLLGHWILLTTNGGITRLDGFNPAATGASDQRFIQQMDMQRLRGMDEVQRDRYFSAQADAYIRETWQQRPGRLLELAVRKTGRTWSPMPLSEDFRRPLYVLVGLAYTVPLYLLAAGGLLLGRLGRSGKCFLLAPAVYLTVIHVMSVGSLRYRLPAEPALAILAAAGLAAAWAMFRPAGAADSQADSPADSPGRARREPHPPV